MPSIIELDAEGTKLTMQQGHHTIPDLGRETTFRYEFILRQEGNLDMLVQSQAIPASIFTSRDVSQSGGGYHRA
jgi:hypothetical protein